MVSEIILSLISSAFVVMIFSFLYKDSIWFHFVTHIYIAGAAAYGVAICLKNIYYQGVVPFTQGSYWYLLALIGCALMFTRFVRGYEWLIRLPSAALIGVGIGLNMAAGVQAQIIAQITDTMKSITTPTLATSVNNLIIIAGVCSVTMFFFFSRETKGAMGSINRVGRCFLMVTLGSSFAYALLGRTSLLIERFKVLVVYPDYYILILAAAVILYDALIRRKRNSLSPFFEVSS